MSARSKHNKRPTLHLPLGENNDDGHLTFVVHFGGKAATFDLRGPYTGPGRIPPDYVDLGWTGLYTNLTREQARQLHAALGEWLAHR